MVELGHINIATKVSLLSSHLAYPREGHLKAALHVMGNLKQKHNSRLIFDPTYPNIDLSSFPTYDWIGPGSMVMCRKLFHMTCLSL
jgi:hypothetical protein